MRDFAKIVIGIAGCAMLAGCSSASSSKLPSATPPAGPQVSLQSGMLVGSTVDGVSAFKGIPYAAPPTGALRWRPPQPVAAWRGVREAKAYAHDCTQLPFPRDAAPLRTTPDEDCLYLNVWRPAGDAKKLPVMVWIYGGGLVNGGTSPAVYDGTRFAQDGVVFVSMNYRLGRFGFFAFPALTAEDADGLHGNYGFMDQIAALEWVRDNIEAFGGDPKNVTIFGESAGGGSVHTLLSTPLAAGLFERAVIESGGGRGNLMGLRKPRQDLPGQPSAETVGVEFAKSAGIEGTGADALGKLRALPAEKVAAGVGLANMPARSGPQTYSGPTEDGKIIALPPDQAYAAGKQAKVPIMVGANSADIGFNFAKTKDEAFAAFGKDATAARRAYDPKGDADLRVVNAEIGMDKTMVEPARFTARSFSGQGLPAYEFRFSYVAPKMAAELAKPPMSTYMPLKGAPHASEIPYVFDTVTAAYGKDTTADDEAMAKKMHAYWVNFAKTGDPNGDSLPHWPDYTRKSDMLMNFTQQGPEVMKDPWRARLDLTAKQAEKPKSKP